MSKFRRSGHFRASSRHPIRIACQAVREKPFQLVADRITDLSLSGMLVVPTRPVLTGERILLSFRLPWSTLWIDSEATVTRVVHGRRAGELGCALGLEIEELYGIPRLLLEKVLRLLPAN